MKATWLREQAIAINRQAIAHTTTTKGEEQMKVGYHKPTGKYYVAEYSKHPEVQQVTIIKLCETLEQVMAWMEENSI